MRPWHFVPPAVVGFVLAVAGPAQAATFTVNTPVDGAPAAGACSGSTSCSLREAVAAANADSAADTIKVPADTYNLTQGQLAVSSPVTITGAGARATKVDAKGASRAFSITGNTTVTDLTVTGGNADATASPTPGSGGGFLVGTTSNLVLRDAAVVGNVASMSGGAVSYGHTGGTGVIERSLIANNTAGSAASMMNASGGAIFAQGGLTLTNSTVTGNAARTMATAQGGGILALAAGVNLVNSTISDNTAAGGTATGGGIMNASSLSATNTIVAGNTGGDCGAAAAGMPLANNLSSDSSCGFTGAGSKQGVDPVLGPLGNNGGPTDTRAIAQSSPAANAGTAVGCPAVDQRGSARPQGPSCDIGAFEAPFASAGGGMSTGGGTGTGGGQQPSSAKPASKGRRPSLKVSGVPRSCRRSAFVLRFRSKVSGAGVKLRSVKITLDGKTIRTVRKAGRFRIRIAAKKLRAGKHTVRARATDSRGRKTSFKKSFIRCKAG